MHYETVIGLEIHVQLATRSKLFCADDAAFGGAPNSHVSAISLAHPGTLPRLNRQAIEYAVQLGLALGCRISRRSVFDRKNYFYADLPKGYQITQDRFPICVGGVAPPAPPKGGSGALPKASSEDLANDALPPEEGRKASHLVISEDQANDALPPLGGPGGAVRLHHIHLEEDAGKSLHDQDAHDSLIDLNRAGVPLLEIVTEPDLRSAAEASACLESIQRLVRWLGISDGNLEEGSLRCDVNVSVRPVGTEQYGTRCEIKNMNSFRFIRRAIEYEAERQIALLENGGTVRQETRNFDPATGLTQALREKEEAHDYRYFPEPDLPPVILTEAGIERIRAAMPPLPQVLERQFQEEFGLPAADAALLTQERETAFYFLGLVAPPSPPRGGSGALLKASGEDQANDALPPSGGPGGASPKSSTQDHANHALPPSGGPGGARALANFIIQRIRPWAETNGRPVTAFPLSAAQIVEYLHLIDRGQLSASAAAQRLLPALLENPAASPAALAADLNLLQVGEHAFLEKLVEEVLGRFPDKVAEYRRGKKGLLGFFTGEVMKASGGRAEPGATGRLLQEKLHESL